MKRICVYCGSSAGAHKEYRVAARALADVLVADNLTLIFGGTRIGLMGVLAEAVLSQGGKAIGVVPSIFANEFPHGGLSEVHIVDSMHERKAMMMALGDAFVALPGGIGTMEEIFEAFTWGVIGLHHKPCGLLNTCEYYAELLAFLDHAVAQGFIKQKHRNALIAAEDPTILLDRLQDSWASTVDKGIRPTV